MSLARRHRERMLASAATATVAGGARPLEGPAATEYELKRAELGQDLQRLRDIQSIEAKIELKRELLPKYDSWAQGALEAEIAEGARAGQDDVVVQTMIWAFDCSDFDRAIPRARHVLRHGLALPERFDRTAGCLVAELAADEALTRIGAGETFPLDTLLEVEELTADEDMPDQVRAKLNKAIGLELARAAAAIEAGGDGPAGAKRAAVEASLKKLRRAVELNPKAGVKKDIERLEREAKNLADAAATGDGAPDQED